MVGIGDSSTKILISNLNPLVRISQKNGNAWP